MIYPEGKCVELLLDRVPSPETTLVIKFLPYRYTAWIGNTFL